jgi:hypothetical protein
MDEGVLPKSLNPLKLVNSFQHKLGIAVYGSGFCVHKDYMKQGISNKFAL